MTIDATGPDMVRLVPELEAFVPPAVTLDKPVYSPWLGSDLDRRLKARRSDTLVVTTGFAPGVPKRRHSRDRSSGAGSLSGEPLAPVPVGPASRKVG